MNRRERKASYILAQRAQCKTCERKDCDGFLCLNAIDAAIDTTEYQIAQETLTNLRHPTNRTEREDGSANSD